MKANFKSIVMLIVIVVAVIVAVSVFSPQDEVKTLNYGELIKMLEDDKVTSLTIDENGKATIKGYKLGDNGEYIMDKEEEFTYSFTFTFLMDRVVSMAEENYSPNNGDAETEAKEPVLKYLEILPPSETPWYVVYLPYILVGLLVVGLWIFMMRQASQAGGAAGRPGAFAKSKAKVAVNDKNAVKFVDVAGADEEKAELEEVVEFLKDPEKFIKLGARIPRGVLLVGPPGTGKTLLAKAVAGEAGVPFFSISGSDFVEMYVGVGASRVRDLFENARKTPASIIFIDEIDAVGRRRGTGLGGGHDEREQTLNQLLVEMDGFGTHSGVIVIAATNRVDILDPALLRPGRFDRQVTVNYPDIKGREEILRVHSRNKPLEATVNLKKIAQSTIGFSGADLANLMNEAALRAAKNNKSLIGMNDIEESFMKMLLGPQKKTRVRTPEDNKLCAYHEAGHAVASYYCKHTDPVKHITIIPAGNAGGVTVSAPTKDQFTMSKNQMLDVIVKSLGGRVAEEVVLDDISTGASGDIQQATSIAKNMVMRYGMSDKLGTVLYAPQHSQDEVFLGRDFSSGQDYSEATAAAIDEEIRRIITDSYDRCRSILTDHIDKLHFVAEFLLKNESMDEDQFRAAMEMENPTVESIEGILEEKQRQSNEENKVAYENKMRAEAEEKARREELAKRMASGEPLTDEVLADIFEKKFNDSPDSNNDTKES